MPKNTANSVKKEPIIKEYGFTFNDFTVVEDTLQSGDTFSTLLEAYSLPDSLKVTELNDKVKDSFNLRNIRAGKEFITFSDKKTKKSYLLLFMFKIKPVI